MVDLCKKLPHKETSHQVSMIFLKSKDWFLEPSRKSMISVNYLKAVIYFLKKFNFWLGSKGASEICS